MFIRISFCLSQSNVYSISSGNIETNCHPRFSLSFIVARRSRSLICCVILLFTQGRLDSLFLTGCFRIRAFLSKTSRNIIFQQIRIASTTFLRFRGSQVFFNFFLSQILNFSEVSNSNLFHCVGFLNQVNQIVITKTQPYHIRMQRK